MPTLNENGVHVGGIVGFLKSIGFAINMFNPTRTIIVFDGLENVEDERRNMLMQLRRVADYLELLPLTTISVDGIEADDAIAYIAKSVIPDGEKVIM